MFPESQFQLDTDYIQRYLGELSLLQESRLVQLRKWVADLQKGKVNRFSLLVTSHFIFVLPTSSVTFNRSTLSLSVLFYIDEPILCSCITFYVCCLRCCFFSMVMFLWTQLQLQCFGSCT